MKLSKGSAEMVSVCTFSQLIGDCQVEGFPPKSELVTAFVEHGVGETEPECEPKTELKLHRDRP